jgi:hypothetical protein
MRLNRARTTQTKGRCPDLLSLIPDDSIDKVEFGKGIGEDRGDEKEQQVAAQGGIGIRFREF